MIISNFNLTEICCSSFHHMKNVLLEKNDYFVEKENDDEL